MKKLGLIVTLALAMVLGGCSAYSEQHSLVLQTSNRSIDVVLHRSDVRFTDCGTLTVIQTYDAAGALIDSKDARGVALHCEVIQAGIQAGGMVGAAAVLRPSKTDIDNSNEQSQGQAQSSSNRNVNRNSNRNHAEGGAGGAGGSGGNSGSGHHGNNGQGNGDGDGSNPGTGHHHDNGDNN